jgi:hypothetical protein
MVVNFNGLFNYSYQIYAFSSLKDTHSSIFFLTMVHKYLTRFLINLFPDFYKSAPVFLIRIISLSNATRNKFPCESFLRPVTLMSKGI